MELVKGIELDIILDLVEMQIVGFYFNKELEISRQKYATQHEIYMDSFERVFSPSKFLEMINRLGFNRGAQQEVL
jgi:hypothetical protein